MEVTSTTLIGQTPNKLRPARAAREFGANFKIAKAARQVHIIDIAHPYSYPAESCHYSAFPMLSSL
jgi:hypothetical protein